MKINHREVKTKLPVSNFMSRVRCLPQEERSFLLDIMNKTRKEYTITYDFYMKTFNAEEDSWIRFARWEKTKRILNFLIQRGSVAVWMLLDSPRKRSVQQIASSLETMKKSIIGHKSQDVYEAMNSTGETIPEYKQREYENRIKEYIQIDDTGRQQFVTKIKFPKKRRRSICPINTARQRED